MRLCCGGDSFSRRGQETKDTVAGDLPDGDQQNTHRYEVEPEYIDTLCRRGQTVMAVETVRDVAAECLWLISA